MKRAFFILLFILLLLLACLLFFKNNKRQNDSQTNIIITTYPKKTDTLKKEAHKISQQEESPLIKTPSFVHQMNRLFEKNSSKNPKIQNTSIKPDFSYVHQKNNTRLTEKENTVFKDSLLVNEKSYLPSIGFAQCGSNSINPDSLSQKLTTGNRKNNLKETISPFENINCGYIQTSFPISF